jgi:hypothetical protein
MTLRILRRANFDLESRADHRVRSGWQDGQPTPIRAVSNRAFRPAAPCSPHLIADWRQKRRKPLDSGGFV